MDVLEIQYIIYIRKEKVPNETIKNLSLLLLTNDVHHLFIYFIYIIIILIYLII